MLYGKWARLIEDGHKMREMAKKLDAMKDVYIQMYDECCEAQRRCWKCGDCPACNTLKVVVKRPW